MANSTAEREALVFGAYLLGVEPPHYVVRKYAEANRMSPAFSRGSAMDRCLVRVAATHPALARLADSYARLFRPRGLLRRKLILLLAILETSPSCTVVDAGQECSRAVLFVRLLGAAVRSVFSTAAGVVVFMPVHLVLAARGDRGAA